MAKKNRTSAEDVLRMMYPDLKTSDDDTPPKVEEKKEDPATTIAQLQARIDQLQGIVSTSTGRTAAPIAKQDPVPMAPVHDYSKAPDPAVDPKGYAAFVLEESRKDVEYEKQLFLYQQRQAKTQGDRVSGLWQDFTENYEIYAKDQTKVEVAATRVAERARAKGIDVDTYMYGTSDQFMKDVVKEIDKLWPDYATKAASAGDEDDDDDDEDNRASFVSPQGAASGKPAPKGEQQGKYGALGQAIIDWQTQTGMHR